MESKAPSDKPGYFDNCLHSSPPIPITPEAEKITRAYLARLRELPSDPSVKRVIAHTMRDLQVGKHLQARAARKAASTKENLPPQTT